MAKGFWIMIGVNSFLNKYILDILDIIKQNILLV
mgnify:CR=1 FL=1